MEPEDEAQLARLMREHKSAEDWEWETRKAIYVFLQRKLRTGQRGTLTALVGSTGYSRQRLGDIKAGKWSRTESKNP